MKVFLSNQTEALVQLLEAFLFASKNPFEKRWVICQNSSAKNYLQQKLASHFGIAAGLALLTESEGARRFFPDCPTQLELSLNLERELRENPPCSLAGYLSSGGPKRVQSLCDELGALFLDHALYGTEELKDWQQELWKRVWPGLGSRRSLNGLVCFFQPTFIPPLYHACYDAAFVLSPSVHFWGDLNRLNKEAENPLLAAWGSLHQKFIRTLDVEGYFKEVQGASLLATLKRDLFRVEKSTPSPDDSLEIHASSSRLQEVEIVWERVQKQKGSVAIFAPDIALYAPYIHLVFGRSETFNDYALFDLKVCDHSPLALPLLKLLGLKEAEEIVSLLSFHAFTNKLGLEEEEIERVKELTDHRDLIGALACSPQRGALSLPLTEAHLVDTWLTLLADTEALLEELKSEKSVEEWRLFLKETIESFFEVTSEDEPILRSLETPLRVSGKFPFSSIERMVRGILEKRSASFQEGYLHATRCSSLKKGSGLPFDTIIVMGLDEDAFPRKGAPSLPGAPTQQEQDQWSFLELLLSAQEKLILTYTALDGEDGKEREPSPLIQELLRYLPDQKVERHPARHYPSFTKREWPEETNALPHFFVTQLKKLARHPLEFYLEHSFGLKFRREEEKHPECVLSPLTLWKIRKQILGEELPTLIPKLEREGLLPRGMWQKAAIKKIEAEVLSYERALASLGVKKTEVFSIELSPFCTKPEEVRDRHFVYPPLSFEDGSLITGKVEDLTPQGILFHGENTAGDLLKAYPLALLLHKLGLPHALLLTKEGEKVELKFQEGDLLHYLEYAKLAAKSPSPLMPSLARWVLKRDGAGFAKALQGARQNDPILTWMFTTFELPPCEGWLSSWSPWLEKLRLYV